MDLGCRETDPVREPRHQSFLAVFEARCDLGEQQVTFGKIAVATVCKFISRPLQTCVETAKAIGERVHRG